MSQPRTPPAILLTGAGFSRNWGGWLANEAFEYLLGCRELNDRVRNLLWQCYEDRSGFEGALARLQAKTKNAADYQSLILALRGMFDVMNRAFPGRNGPDIGSGHKGAKFMARFDAIFTLNQDLLLELGYSPASPWNTFRLPGTVPFDQTKSLPSDLRVPADAANFKLASNFQPYFKLHGSSAFRSNRESEDALLIMGGDKRTSIDGSELLKWYRSEFVRHLAIPDTRLLVIGYSFGDQHINELLREAAKAGTGFQMFIIDPGGADVLYNRPMGKSTVPPNHNTDKLLKVLTPVLAGASRRSFGSLFNGDDVELSKVLRFFDR